MAPVCLVEFTTLQSFPIQDFPPPLGDSNFPEYCMLYTTLIDLRGNALHKYVGEYLKETVAR